ncbi:MAG: DUF1194 domain-containing protein [Hyphomicrobiaceae bacterium]
MAHLRFFAAILALTLPLLAPVRAAGDVQVDLELVLAVDVSLSMDLDEQRLQRDGYVAAFRDGGIHKAIQAGTLGRIAVIYVEWAGPGSHHVVLPWMPIDGPTAAEKFAEQLENQPISRMRMTSVSGGLAFAARQFTGSGFAGTRRVIDISGDGPNNSGGPVTEVRDDLVGQGIVINGLPIVLKPGSIAGFFDISDLDLYYRDCVIGGPGAFMIPVRHKSEFAPAIRRKLILEISAREPEPQLRPVQEDKRAPPGDCMIGEHLWRRYMDGRFRE